MTDERGESDPAFEDDPLEAELAALTNTWALPILFRAYQPTNRGAENFRDEAWLLEEHRYSTIVARAGKALTATYRKLLTGEAGPVSTFVRTYEALNESDAVAFFEEDAADLAQDDDEDGYTPESRRWTPGEATKPIGKLVVRYAKTPPVPIIVWSYPGRNQIDAGELYETHAVELAAKGYLPVAQSWADGMPGRGRIFMLGMMASVRRPKGFLTVTYRLVEPATAAPASPSADPIEQIERLGRLRDNGLITADEFEAKKTDLLARM